MELKKIAVENFRSHRKIEVELATGVTILTGRNGSGKSTLAETPVTVMIGDNTWASRSGINLASQIRKGAKQAKLSLVGNQTVTRVIGQKGSKLILVDKDGKDHPLTQPMILKNLKVTAPQVRAALCPQSFLGLDLKEMKEVLFDLLSTEITMATVSRFIPKDAEPTWTKLAKRWGEDHPDETTVDLDDLYKWVYEARRNYKAKKSAPTESPDHKAKVKQLGDVSQKIASANYGNERIKIGKEMRANLPQMEERLAELKGRQSDLAALVQARDERDKEILEYEKKIAGIEAVMAENRQAVDLFGQIETKGKDKKVVCPLGLECPHDAKGLKERKALLDGTEIAKSGELKGAREHLKAAREQKQKADVEVQKARGLNDDIEQLEKEIRTAQDIKDEEYIDVDELKDEKARIEMELADLAAKPAADDSTVDHLNDIVNTLNVNGIKTEVVRKKATDLEKEVNEALAKFGAWTIRFFVEAEFSPTILTKDGECRIGELSDGERAMLSLIIQDAFSRRTGLNLVVVDNVDLLDPGISERFFETAAAVPSKVVVAMANAPDHTLPKDVRVVALDSAEAPKQAASSDKPVEDIL